MFEMFGRCITDGHAERSRSIATAQVFIYSCVSDASTAFSMAFNYYLAYLLSFLYHLAAAQAQRALSFGGQLQVVRHQHEGGAGFAVELE